MRLFKLAACSLVLTFASCVDVTDPIGDEFYVKYTKIHHEKLATLLNEIEQHQTLDKINLEYNGLLFTEPEGFVLSPQLTALVHELRFSAIRILRYRGNGDGQQGQVYKIQLPVYGNGFLGGISKGLLYVKAPATLGDVDFYDDLDLAYEKAISHMQTTGDRRRFKGYKDLGNGWYVYLRVYF